MERGLPAALSFADESILRRIAQGGVYPKSLRDSDVVRLKKLDLIEERRTGLALTALGHQCIGQLAGMAAKRPNEQTID